MRVVVDANELLRMAAGGSLTPVENRVKIRAEEGCWGAAGTNREAFVRG